MDILANPQGLPTEEHKLEANDSSVRQHTDEKRLNVSPFDGQVFYQPRISCMKQLAQNRYEKN
jgi:hypothetical protein